LHRARRFASSLLVACDRCEAAKLILAARDLHQREAALPPQRSRRQEEMALARVTPTLALSMIVRDAALLLPACLESVRGIVDEIVIADTGSADDTIALALGFGAHVIPIPWTDDFAEARNRALAAVKSDWVLVLDADEQLDTSSGQQIASLLANPSIAAYQVTIRNYTLSLEDRIWDRAAKSNDSRLPAARAYPAYVEHENVRLFRRDPEVYFVGRVHESVGSRVLETKRKLGRAPFCIHHFGLVADAESRARKNHFYRRLGREKLQDMPRDAQAHLELGLVELDNFGNLAEALALFERACRLNSHFGVAWLFQGLTLVKLQRFDEALKCLSEAERQGHITSLLYETQADAHYNLKQYPGACASYDRALVRDPGNPLLQSKLGLAIVRTGNTERGLRLIRQAIETKPTAGELHDRLILSLVWLGRIEEAGAAAEAKLGATERPAAVDFLRAASLWAKVKNWPRAATVLQAGLEAFPTDITLGRGLTEVTQTADLHATAAESSSSCT
jgi:tetratricopeptide (TPR) repeat protein